MNHHDSEINKLEQLIALCIKRHKQSLYGIVATVVLFMVFKDFIAGQAKVLMVLGVAFFMMVFVAATLLEQHLTKKRIDMVVSKYRLEMDEI